MIIFLKDVSVVISVFSINRAVDVVKCVNSVKRQSLKPKEIIVVLDPNEELVHYYKKLLTDVKIVISSDFGLSFARNTGVVYSQSEIIAFIDDDAVADEKWLETLVSNYDDPSVIGVGGRIEPVWDNAFPAWLPEELYWIVGCSYKGLPKKKAAIRNPIGCNMSFERNVIEKVGYFNTGVGRIGNKLSGHDDTEFGIRATEKIPDSKIVYEPDAIVYHHVPKKRSNIQYVINRSFAEGYSKACIKKQKLESKSVLNSEKHYLQQVLLEGIFERLIKNTSSSTVSQAFTLSVSVSLVLFGYLIGSL